jgi:hypothetical protein
MLPLQKGDQRLHMGTWARGWLVARSTSLALPTGSGKTLLFSGGVKVAALSCITLKFQLAHYLGLMPHTRM